jgi:hypothetical protein
MRDVIRCNSTQEFPDVTPFAVHKHFVNLFKSTWQPICLESFQRVEHAFQEVMEELCEEHFGRFKTSHLWDDAKYMVSLT